MTNHDPIDYARIDAEVRALRAAEMRRLMLAAAAWVRRTFARRPAARAAARAVPSASRTLPPASSVPEIRLVLPTKSATKRSAGRS